MVEGITGSSGATAAELDRLFRALGDASRRQMLYRLTAGPMSIGELGAPLAMSFAGASKHVKVLESAGLVERRREGRRHLCRLRPERLAQAHEWLAFYQRFWTARLDALADALGADQAPPDEVASSDSAGSDSAGSDSAGSDSAGSERKPRRKRS